MIWVLSPSGARDLSFLQNIQTSSEAHIRFPFNRYRRVSAVGRGVKWWWHKAGHLPPPSADVKGDWSCTFTPTVCLQNMCVKTFTFYILQRVIATVMDIKYPDNSVHNAKRLHNIFWTKMSTLASILTFNCRKHSQLLEIRVIALFPSTPATPKHPCLTWFLNTNCH